MPPVSSGPAGTTPGSLSQPGGSSLVGGGAAGKPGATIQPGGLLALLGLLGTPPNDGVETPNLQHFGDVASTGAAVATQAAPRGAPSSALTGTRPHLPPALWLALLLSLVATLAVRIVARRSGRARFSRAAEIAAGPILLVLVGCAVAIAPSGSRALTFHRYAATAAAPQSTPAAQAAQAAQVPLRSVATATAEATPGASLLAQLTTYESQVARDETQIGVLTALAADQASQGASSPAPATPQRGPFDDSTDPATTVHQVATSLEATLQQEYNLLLSAAHDPAQVEGLVQASSDKPVAERQAVAYDVQAVEAQLAQEAAISEAAQGSSAGTAAAPTALQAPLTGPITQPFGPSSLAFEPALTFNGVTYPHFHTGVDIAGPLDAPIHAAADGVVAIAGAETDSQGRLVGYGNYVVIAHAGRMITLYGHLDELLVHVGQAVHAGDVIGLEGSSGNSTGPHLHFEVRVADLLSDPTKYLGAQLEAA